MVDIGVFIPIGNNGWLLSENAPKYKPSFDLNKQIVLKAEKYGFDFALSMIKLRGFGGKTQFWNYSLESFTLMSALAAVTTKIKLIASCAILTIPPAIAARMASTIDSVAPGRFGINIVTGWQSEEYSQMGLWPGDAFFRYRYGYATEYVRILRDLWTDGKSDFKGQHFYMDDCKLSPQPSNPIKIVVAGQSEKGVEFAAQYADFNFCMGSGFNTPTAFGGYTRRLVQTSSAVNRDVGAYVVFMIIADETNEAAESKWKHYKDGIDIDAVSWMASQTAANSRGSPSPSSSRTPQPLPEGAVNLNTGTLVGSYSKVAAMLDEIAAVEGVKGIMLVFDDFLIGLDVFGERVQPLMKSRQGR